MSSVSVVAMVFPLLGILWGSESTGLLTSRSHNHKGKTFLPKVKILAENTIFSCFHTYFHPLYLNTMHGEDEGALCLCRDLQNIYRATQ